MAYKERDTVVLVRDVPEHFLASGQTQALVMLEGSDLRAVRDQDLIAVRQVDHQVGGAI